MFRLAHLSDPHVAPLPRPRLGELMNKRLFGYLSWLHHRKSVHRADLLERLTEDLRAERPDHVVVTGDLVNISLPGEFVAAADWLKRLGTPDRVTVVPGNHDAYVALPFSRSWVHWAGYMSNEADGNPGREPAGFGDFPLIRRRGPVAVVGTSSARPTGPGMATGKLGAAQVGELERQLALLGREGLFRVVLVHHPPLDETTKRRKRLLDSAEFRAALGRAGAELVLHGHDHRFLEAELDGDTGPVPVFGIPSASARPYSDRPGAHYLLYDVIETGTGWSLTVRARGFEPGNGGIGERFTRTIALPRPRPGGKS
ncbi:MAG: metallophosphoesterase [Kiloniellales bacterium]|nr:metallophosphoesterase [Kiloniellales bacterium]